MHIPNLDGLYQDLISGNPRAPERIVAVTLLPMVRALRRRYMYLPPDMLQDAAIDALLRLITRPHEFNPERGTLGAFLVMMADFRMRSRLRTFRRRRELYVGGVEDVEMWAEVAFGSFDSAVVANGRNDRWSVDTDEVLKSLLPNEQDRKLVELVCEGRTSTYDYAVVLGIENLPEDEQRKEVKRNRDRVMKRIRRSRDRWSELHGAG